MRIPVPLLLSLPASGLVSGANLSACFARDRGIGAEEKAHVRSKLVAVIGQEDSQVRRPPRHPVWACYARCQSALALPQRLPYRHPINVVCRGTHARLSPRMRFNRGSAQTRKRASEVMVTPCGSLRQCSSAYIDDGRRTPFNIGMVSRDGRYLLPLQFAVLLALVFAKIARIDYPRYWPSLMEDLLAVTAEGDGLRRRRAYLVLHHVLKELSSKRLAADQRTFAEVRA